MIPVSVSVTFRKQVSDGNYGTESAEAHIQVDLDPQESNEQACTLLLAQARGLVHEELSRSPGIAVRRALTRQEPPPPKRDFTPEDTPF